MQCHYFFNKKNAKTNRMAKKNIAPGASPYMCLVGTKSDLNHLRAVKLVLLATTQLSGKFAFTNVS